MLPSVFYSCIFPSNMHQVCVCGGGGVGGGGGCSTPVKMEPIAHAVQTALKYTISLDMCLCAQKNRFILLDKEMRKSLSTMYSYLEAFKLLLYHSFWFGTTCRS